MEPVMIKNKHDIPETTWLALRQNYGRTVRRRSTGMKSAILSAIRH